MESDKVLYDSVSSGLGLVWSSLVRCCIGLVRSGYVLALLCMIKTGDGAV